MKTLSSTPAGEALLSIASPHAASIGAVLVQAGRLTPEDAERIHAHQAGSGQLYEEAGIELGLLTAQDVQNALARQFGQLSPGAECGLSGELIAAWQADSPVTEHLRSLRSQLMLRWFENDARHAALSLVSPGRGEGRSYITANLAVLFAQLGKRTLVIDADLRHPRQHRLFGAAGRQGLSGVLAGRLGTDCVLDIDAVPGLSLLPAGVQPPNPQELLARGGLPRLLSALRSRFEVILVDTPAFDECADAGTIGSRAGAALMVACRDSTSVSALGALAEGLREFGVTVVGAVFNTPHRA